MRQPVAPVGIVNGRAASRAAITLFVLLVLLACAGPLAAAPRVRLITTGGTIANAPGGRLTPDDLLHTLPDRRALGVRIDTEAFSNASSTFLSLDDWDRLSARIAAIFASDQGIAGVVVTSGTDTLEELAWFLHLTVGDARPVVVVGAMRPPDTAGADGPINLADAIRVAASASARARGTLVVMHGQVHAAVEVRKLHATRIGAFDTEPYSVLGTVSDGRVAFRTPARPRPLPGLLAAGGRELLPRVDVLLTYQGATGDLIDAAVDGGARGLVLAAAGAGSLTPAQADAARRASARVPVVVSSRTGGGAVRDFPDASGFISAGDLPPLKARLLLTLALAQGADRARIARLFEEASGVR